MPGARIRPAAPADDAVIDRIAREGDAGADAGYLALLRSQAVRLLVAELDGSVVAFGGAVSVDEPAGATMLTDLFVTPVARGCGIGGQLLAELFGDAQRRMTSSSKHDAALPAYRRTGMTPRWRLLYFVGRGRGSAGAVPVGDGVWRHGRRMLIDEWARRGAVVAADTAVLADDDGLRIGRLQSDDPVAVLLAILRSIDSATTVRLCVPEHSPVASTVATLGFEIEDHDIWCAAAGVELPEDLHVLDPGLG